MKHIKQLLVKNLTMANMPLSAHEYCNRAGTTAAASGLLVWLISGLLLEEMIVTFLYGIAGGVFVFCILLFIPHLQKKHFADKIDAELPFVLLAIAAERNMNIPLAKSLEQASQQKKSLFAAELKKVVDEYKKKGVPLQQALFSLAERIDSRNVKRAILQLCHLIEQGKNKDGENIKRIAQELLSKQKAESREYNGKMAVFSLLFIAVSAIAPALFQSFIVVGSMVLSIQFTPMQVLVIIAAVFPLLDIAVLVYIRSRAPAFLKM